MTGIDFVVSIGVDQHEVLQLGPGEQILQQVERRSIGGEIVPFWNLYVLII
jgi:hypothetical protein